MGKLRILVLSHCILNQATRWWQKGKPLSKNLGINIDFLRLLSDLRIGVIQMPCPEFTFRGNPRPPRTRDEYLNLPGFLEHCMRLADETAKSLKNFVDNACEPSIKILAIIGVERSPTCGVKNTPVGTGMDKRYENRKGIFIELLLKSLRKLNLEIPVVGIDLNKPEEFFNIVQSLVKSS